MHYELVQTVFFTLVLSMVFYFSFFVFNWFRKPSKEV
jgi:hypothetical protein